MNPCVIPAPPEDHDGDSRKMSMHRRFVQQARTTESEVLFIGDSIIDQLQFSPMWDEKFSALHCVNFGIGGDKVENVLWRLQNGELEFNSKIRAVVVLVGTNNTNCTPLEVFEGILEVVKTIRTRLGQEVTSIVLLTLLPRGQHPNAYRDRNDQVNALLMDHYKEQEDNVHLVPIHLNIVQNDQTISHHLMHDYLHLTMEAYGKVFEPVYRKLYHLLS